MPKTFTRIAFVITVSLCASGVYAATSMPMPEAGFSLASNSGGGVDTIATPMSSDLGGGAIREPARVRRGAEATVETPSGETASSDTAATITVREEHPHKSSASDGASSGAAGPSGHKSHGNAHWQSLLPGLMK